MSWWKMVKLGDVCQVIGGGTPRRNSPSFFGGGIPWATPTDVTALDGIEIEATKETLTEEGLTNSSAKLLPAGAVLLTSRATIGYTAVAKVPICTNQGFANFICGPNVAPEFLAFWLPTQKEEMLRLAAGTTFKEISKSTLKGMTMPLPPLPEQRRIVDILNHANSIRRLRREALEKARALIPALFVEMFGDPIPDNCYPIKPLSEVAEVVSGVTKGRKFNRIEPIEVPYLRVANVQAGYLDLTEIKSILALPEEVERLKLMPGDVLLTEGGDFDKLGRGALWQGQVENCIHQNHVFRVRVNQLDLIPQYFVSFLQTGQAKNYFLRCAKRTTNLASINMTQLRGLPVPVPSIGRQEVFADRITDTRAIIDQQQRQLAKADEMMNALMARFFGNGAGLEAAA